MQGYHLELIHVLLSYRFSVVNRCTVLQILHGDQKNVFLGCSNESLLNSDNKLDN
jgi:hypothetical protein